MEESLIGLTAPRVAILALVLWACSGSSSPTTTQPVAQRAEIEAADEVGGADAERVLARIHSERARLGLPRAEIATDLRPLRSAILMIREGAPPEVALRTALQRVADDESSDLYYWVALTNDLDQVALPAQFLASEEPEVAVAVARQIGEAPSSVRYVVCLVLIEGGSDWDDM